MRIPTIEIIDSTELPRPDYETGYERGLISDYYEVRRGYHEIRRHGTLTWYLMYTVSGRGFFRDAEDRLLCVGRGDLVLIEPSAYQEYGIWRQSTRWHAHWVHFEAQPHWSPWLPLTTPSGLRGVSFAHLKSRSLQQQMSHTFFELQAQRTRPETWRHALCLNLVERILILACSAGEASRPIDPRVLKVLRAIETSAAKPLSGEELASSVGLSPSRLRTLFKRQTGESMLAAVHRARLRAAQHALVAPGATVAEAAERAGFQSPYSFSNWFLSQTGLRPGQFRQQWLKSEGAPRPDRPWLLPRRGPGGS